jgi:ADP-ribose pyrophosphatase YjhB (NUDIX family)
MDHPQSVAGIVFSPDRTSVLLVKRRDVPVWVLPGGGIDAGEWPEQAVVREILEESGFTVKAQRLVGDYIPINRLSKRTHLYECTLLKGEAKVSAETRDVHFFPLSALPPLPPPYLDWIQDAVKQLPPIQKKISSVSYLSLIKNLILHPILVLRFLLARAGCSVNTKDRK